jgi:hypothetical protein
MNTQEVETKIVDAILDALLGAGYAVGVNDGEDTVLQWSQDRTEIISKLRSTDSDMLLVHEIRKQGDGYSYRRIGWILLIWGNAHDLLSDHTTNLDDVLLPVYELSNVLEAA